MSNIISISDFTSFSGKTSNNDVAVVVAGINDYIENFTNRCWGETKQITERYNLDRTIWLRKQDVVSVDSMSMGWPGQNQSTVASSAYFFNSYGRITMFYQFLPFVQGSRQFPSPAYNDYLSITYTYGVLNVPEDLKMATLSLAYNFLNWVISGGKDVVATSVGSYRLEFSGAVRGTTAKPNPAINTAEANWGIISSYRQKRQ